MQNNFLPFYKISIFFFDIYIGSAAELHAEFYMLQAADLAFFCRSAAE